MKPPTLPSLGIPKFPLTFTWRLWNFSALILQKYSINLSHKIHFSTAHLKHSEADDEYVTRQQRTRGIQDELCKLRKPRCLGTRMAEGTGKKESRFTYMLKIFLICCYECCFEYLYSYVCAYIAASGRYTDATSTFYKPANQLSWYWITDVNQNSHINMYVLMYVW